jgi:hypothetical protein
LPLWHTKNKTVCLLVAQKEVHDFVWKLIIGRRDTHLFLRKVADVTEITVWKQLGRESITAARCTVERASWTWVEWFNNRRLLQPIGDVPPAEYERLYHQQTESSKVA